MTLKQFKTLKPGDTVKLIESVEGRYSDYGTNPKFIADIGTVLTVTSEILPTVLENGRGNCFVNCNCENWEPGVSVQHWQIKQVKL